MVVVGGAGASGRPSKPRIGFTLANVVEEDHGTPIYGLCFNDVDPDLCDCFATVGANRVRSVAFAAAELVHDITVPAGDCLQIERKNGRGGTRADLSGFRCQMYCGSRSTWLPD